MAGDRTALEISIQAVHKRLSRGRDLIGEKLAPDIGSLAALLGVLVPAVGGVLWAAHAVRDAIEVTSPDARLPGPPVRARPPAAPRPALPHLPGEAAARADPVGAAAFVDDGTRAPDYVVRSESTQIDSAIFGAHELQPMDAYGRELYEPVSRAFVMHVALCMWKSVLDPDERPRIELDLRFSLWPDRDGSARRRRDAPMAQEHDVTYRLAGMELSSSQTIAFTLCLQEAFDYTRFPEPRNGAPRVIQHHIVIDFCVLAVTFQLLAASADAQARR